MSLLQITIPPIFMNTENKQGTRKILVATRGDYVTRLTLDPLLRGYPPELLHIIIVSTDSQGRSGISQLKALWKEYEWHFFFFELYQFIVFKIAQRLFPKTAFNVQSLAESCNISLTVTDNINSPEIITFAHEWQPDILVSVKCTQRIHSALLAVAKLGSINVHGSLLPKYAGRAPHFWAMAHAEDNIGTTVHRMTERFDEGNMIIKKSIALLPMMSVFSVITAVARLGGEALMEALPAVINGTPGTPQDLNQRSYYSSPTTTGYKHLKKAGYRLLAFGELFKVIHAENHLTRKYQSRKYQSS